MKIAVICHSQGSSLQAGKAARDGFSQAGHDADCVFVGECMAETLLAMRPDVAFDVAFGPEGESGAVQNLLSILEIPCIGANAQACRRAGDGALFVGAMESYWAVAGADLSASWPIGHCVSKDAFFEWGIRDCLETFEERIPGGFPLCVRPARGCGAEKVESVSQMEQALERAFEKCPDALIQQWIDGVEMDVCVIGSGWDAYALPPVERLSGEKVAPVRLGSLSGSEEDAQAIRSEIERAALEAYWAFNMMDAAVVRMIWDGGQARVIRVDPHFSVEKDSSFDLACRAAGLSVASVLNELADVYA